MKALAIMALSALFLFCIPSISFAQQPACDYKVEVLADGNEFGKSDFKWKMKATKIEGKSTNITGTAEIEDSTGKTVKSYKPWVHDAISRQKTSNEYSPNLKPGSYKITAEISVECDDTNKGNNADTIEIKISGETEDTGSKKIKKEDSEKNTLENTNPIDTSKISSGQAAQANQNSIKTESKSRAPPEETENTIQLKSKNIQKDQKSQLTASAVQEPGFVYESSNEKAKGLIMVFLLTLSILLNIILIWKR